MSRKIFLLIAPLFIIALLAACAGGGGAVAPTDMAQAVQPTDTPVPATATPQPTVTATPEPTLTPTVTLTPTPTEAPLPELGSFWQAYVDAHSKEVSVKVVGEVPSLVGKMSSGQEVIVAKYVDGKWASETSMEPFRDGEIFLLEDAFKFRAIELDDKGAISPEAYDAMYADAQAAYDTIKGSFSGIPTEFSTLKSSDPVDVNIGYKMSINVDRLSDLHILGAATLGTEGVRVFIVSTSEGVLPFVRMKDWKYALGGGSDNGDKLFAMRARGEKISDESWAKIAVFGSDVYNPEFIGEVDRAQLEYLMSLDVLKNEDWDEYIMLSRELGHKALIQLLQQKHKFLGSYLVYVAIK